MNDAVTFFRDRDKDGGVTYQLEVEGAKDPTHVIAYAQRRVDAPVLQGVTIDARDLQSARADLRNSVQGQGGGGVIVVVRDEGRSRTFTVMPVNAKGHAASERCMVLSPGRPPAQLNANGNEARFPAGSHLLVPVSQEAEQRLQEFVGYLAWISPDLESLVLNAIRRPSLDKRLDRVETKVFAETADQSLTSPPRGRFGRARAVLARSVPTSVMRITAAVLLVLLLGLNSVLLYGLHSKVDSQGEPVFASSLGRPALRGQPFENEAKELFDALETKKNDPLLRQLATTHFTGHPAASWEDDQLVVLGLIKLQLLALLDDPQPGLDFLRGPAEIDTTNAAYEDVQSKLVTAPEARALLQALACRVDTTPKLAFRNDCDNVSDRDLERGLRELTEFVKGRRP
ncbi:MAG TPA: hypothetical protein VF846_09240 [Thermoanaerobaculia bacterium]|jgi:hypothetical protein